MIEIRAACTTDLEQLLVLLPQLSSRATSPGAQVASTEEAKQIFAQMHADNRLKLLVAVETNTQRLLGSILLVVVPNLTYSGRPWAIIENVVVARSERRRGVGRQMIEEAVKLARAEGCYKVQLISGTKPEQLAFYKELGFQTEQSVGHKLYL